MLVAGGSRPKDISSTRQTFWPGRLQTLLRDAARVCRRWTRLDVHVGSIAKSGVGSEGLSLIFEKVLGRYPRLQMIVILIGASDMLRWLEAGTPDTPPPVEIGRHFRWHPESTFRWKPKQLALVELLLQDATAMVSTRRGSGSRVQMDWTGTRHAEPMRKRSSHPFPIHHRC